MTRTELFEIIANGENSGVEFKRDDVRPEQVAKECVALLNLKGGDVLLGVEDEEEEYGNISGLTRSNCEEWLMDTVFGRYIKPQTIPYYEEINTDNGKVGVISLERGVAKPYSVVSRDREDVYIRVGSESKLADRNLQLRLAQEGGHFHIENLPVNGTSLEDMDLDRFIWYYSQCYDKNAFQNEESSENQKEIEKTLEKLDFIKERQDNGYALTIAGLLLFGEAPNQKFPQAGFRIISFQGEDRDLNADFDELIDAPIVSITRDNQTEKYGLFNIVMNRLQSLLSNEKIDKDGVTRIRKWTYPQPVLRELMVNAIAHRDWTKNNTNKIEIFTDRIEITSSGAIPNTLTIEKIKAGQQYPRNPNLVRILRDIGEMDDRGMGIRRRVIPELENNGFDEPEFEANEDYFKITIYKEAYSS